MDTTSPTVAAPHVLQLSPRAGSQKHFVEMQANMVYRQFDDRRPLPGGRQLRYDFLRPSSPTPTPLVIFIKGGAFRNMHKSRYLPQLMDLAKAGLAVASIEYRTSNECVFPGQLNDVKAAVRYFRAHAEELHLDPHAVAVWGNSAGGTLATLLGATNKEPEHEGKGEYQEYSSNVSAVVNWYGVTDAASMPDAEKADSPVALLLGEPASPESSVTNWFTPGQYLGADTPHMLIMHGDHDTVVPYRQSEILAQALAEKGLPFDFYRIAGAHHSFEQFSTQTDALNITAAFLMAHLWRTSTCSCT